MGWGRAAAALGLAAVFAGTLVAGVALHLDTAPARGAMSALLERAARDGARDDRGAPALEVEGVEVTLDPWVTVRTLLEREGPILVSIPRLSVRRAVLRPDRAPRIEPVALPSFAGRPVAISIERIEIERLAIARAEVTAAVPIEGRVAGRLRAGGGLPALADLEVAARVGDAPLTAAAWLRGDALTAVLHAPRVEPAVIVALAPEAPLRRPVAITARASGGLAALDIEARVAVAGEDTCAPVASDGGGEIAVQARVAGLPPRWITAEVAARAVDPRAFHEAAPDARVSAAAHAAVALGDGPPRGLAALRLEPLRIAGRSTPAASAWARFHGAAIQGQAEIREPGAPIAISFAGSGDALAARGRVEIPDLRRLVAIPLGAVRAEVAVLTASAASSAAGLDLFLDEARLEGPAFALVLAGAPPARGVPRSEQPAATQLRVHLGRDVRVTGDLWIRSGALKLLGRRVALEPGRIRLREGRRPHLDVSASYPTSRGTRIRIRYRGEWDPAMVTASLPSAP